ncbi:MAG: UvrY/SirA/GacA family response regulator transcription factor [Gammaproteobacteria bacterium]|nr:UvrY/SirA/GacA family response regulator transcription factor [Gammaproteobacteria bacterium]
MIKVLVVDDHDLVRTGIARMLEDEDGVKVVGEAGSGEDAIKLTRELAPNVVLMDVKMPGIGGLEATRKILRANAEVRIIAVTACAEEPFPSRVLQAGASGYLTKGAGIDEMVTAIRQVYHGQRYLSPEIAQALALKQLSLDGKTTPFETLSEREMQIAIMIVNCQKVQDISDALCVSPKTVNSYRYRIFEKLEISSDVELTLLAMRHGIVDFESSN